MLISVAVIGLLLAAPRFLILWLMDSTYYADGYSDAKFLSIRHGMRESNVVRILGSPLKVREAEQCIEWIYGSSNLRVSDHICPYKIQEPIESEIPSRYTILIADPSGQIMFASGGYLGVNAWSLVGSSLAKVESRFGKPLKVLGQAHQSQ
jgi:hypothetical protein